MERIYEDEFQDVLELKEEKELKILVSPHTYGNTRLILKEEGEYRIELAPMHSTSIHLFIQNKAQGKVRLHLLGDIQENADVKLGLLDLEDTDFVLYESFDLKAPGARIELYTAQLCQDQKKKGDILVRHSSPYTYGYMHNFAVLKDGANYEMVANGTIDKGAREAASHQETRVLTVGKEHATKVIPLLMIDENDVKASHALTIGEPDENQLYYLESRGLSKEMALGLLSVGYFMPTIEMIQEEEIREKTREEMERKVGVYGH